MKSERSADAVLEQPADVKKCYTHKAGSCFSHQNCFKLCALYVFIFVLKNSNKNVLSQYGVGAYTSKKVESITKIMTIEL